LIILINRHQNIKETQEQNQNEQGLLIIIEEDHHRQGEKNALKKNRQENHVATIAVHEQDQSDRETEAEVEVEIAIQDREEVETEMIEDEILTEVEIDHVIEIEDEDNCPIINSMTHTFLHVCFSSFTAAPF